MHGAGENLLADIQREVVGACRKGRRSLRFPWNFVLLALVLPGPGPAQSPWAGVVLKLRQDHGDGKPVLSQDWRYRRSRRLRAAVAEPGMF